MPTLPASANRLPEAGLTSEAVNYGIGIRWSAVLLLVGGISGLIAMLVIATLMCARPRSPRNSAITFGLNRCGDIACFLGMIPGVTPWAEVRAAFNKRTSIPLDPPDGEIRLYPLPVPMIC